MVERWKKLKNYDTADYLDNPQIINLYLEEILQSDDAALICHAFDAVMRARCKAPEHGI